MGVPLNHPFRTMGIFHEIKHPASLGYPYDYGKPHMANGLQTTSDFPDKPPSSIASK